jgi:hypothetical protein
MELSPRGLTKDWLHDRAAAPANTAFRNSAFGNEKGLQGISGRCRAEEYRFPTSPRRGPRDRRRERGRQVDAGQDPVRRGCALGGRNSPRRRSHRDRWSRACATVRDRDGLSGNGRTPIRAFPRDREARLALLRRGLEYERLSGSRFQALSWRAVWPRAFGPRNVTQ